MLRLFAFLLPCLWWLFLMRDFIFGGIPVNMDTNTIYAVAKYYFNNLANGVVPLWEPFVVLGRPFYALSICNLFNPITQLMLVAKMLGANYYAGFILYITAYFFTTAVGFYFLAKEILKDRHLAYVAFVAFVFSSIGPSMFTQLTFLEILAPILWFCFFLMRFIQQQTRGHFLGVCLSVMMVLSSYLPFYFLTAFLVGVVCAVCLYPKASLEFMGRKIQFFRRHYVLSVIGMLGIITAALPLLMYKALDTSGDVVAPGRHCQYTTMAQCYERTMNQQGGMLYEEITRAGSLGERLDMGSLFAHLDKLTYGSDSLFFVPVFIYLIFFISLFVRLDRLSVFMILLAGGIGLIALGSATPVHRFLYDHVFYFHYFRNLFFLGAFLIPLLILIALKQWQSWLAFVPKDFSQKKGAVVLCLALHVLFLCVLLHYTDVVWTSIATVVLSAVMMCGWVLGLGRVQAQRWAYAWALLVLIQPSQVIAAYAWNAAEFKCTLPSAHVNPEFAWERPDKPATSTCRIYQFVPYEDFWYAMSMTDAPPKVGFPQSAAKETFALSQSIGEEALQAYARYKIVIYPDGDNPIALAGPTPQVHVAHFDVNTLELDTAFERDTQLVYNDSFTKGWRAFIDQKPVPLEIANKAFKGVRVPAGKHRVTFRFLSRRVETAYVATALVLFIFLVFTLLMLYWDNRKKPS